MVESGEVDGMVVAKLDRYFRDQLGGHETMKRIKDAKGFLAIPGDGIDTRTQGGKMQFGFLLTIAENDIDRTRDIFADARSRAVARGIHPSPVPPPGYTRDQDAETRKILGPLRPTADGPIITTVIDRASRGEGWTALARFLESRGVLTAYGAQGWDGRAVKNLVRNPVYLGHAYHGEFVNKEAHPPLTDEVTWNRAQRRGARNAPARSNDPGLLTGLMRCAGCGYGMQSYFSRDRRVYRCHRRAKGGGALRCSAPASLTVTEDTDVEAWAVDQFFAQLGTLRAEPIEEVAGSDLAAIDTGLSGAVVELEGYRDQDGIIAAIGMDSYVAGLEKRQAVVDRWRERRADAEAAADRPPDLDPVELREVWDELPVDDRRRLLQSHIDCVFLRRGRRRQDGLDGYVHVCWRGDGPELPKRGGGGDLRPRPFTFPDPPAGARVKAR